MFGWKRRSSSQGQRPRWTVRRNSRSDRIHKRLPGLVSGLFAPTVTMRRHRRRRPRRSPPGDASPGGSVATCSDLAAVEGVVVTVLAAIVLLPPSPVSYMDDVEDHRRISATADHSDFDDEFDSWTRLAWHRPQDVPSAWHLPSSRRGCSWSLSFMARSLPASKRTRHHSKCVITPDKSRRPRPRTDRAWTPRAGRQVALGVSDSALCARGRCGWRRHETRPRPVRDRVRRGRLPEGGVTTDDRSDVPQRLQSDAQGQPP